MNIKKIIRKIKDNTLIRFTIYLKIVSPIVFLLLYNLGLNIMELETIIIGSVCSLSISLTLIILHINNNITKNYDLIVRNYWKLKNELTYLKKRK